MLAANEAVASFLTERHVGFLRRAHADPEPGKLKQFAEFAGSMGYPVENPLSRFDIQKVLDETVADLGPAGVGAVTLVGANDILRYIGTGIQLAIEIFSRPQDQKQIVFPEPGLYLVRGIMSPYLKGEEEVVRAPISKPGARPATSTRRSSSSGRSARSSTSAGGASSRLGSRRSPTSSPISARASRSTWRSSTNPTPARASTSWSRT